MGEILSRLRMFCPAVLLGLLVWLPPCHAWRPALYPQAWTPPETSSVATDKLIQDFSYAGYRRGEEPVPVTAGPIFDAAAGYGADPTGASDSTGAIQAAIDDAALAGGGVVFLPAGTYLVQPSAGNTYALQIASSGIVLRGAGVGQTMILNTSYQMRSKAVIHIAPPTTPLGTPVAITADLDRPTRRIPVAEASAFQEGDMVRMEWTFTQDWIDEHQQNAWWSAPGSAPARAQYLREVTAVNTGEGWIEIDVPTRYAMLTRDNARVLTISDQLSGVGIEDLSIGNVQHPGSEWGEGDYAVAGRAAHAVHASWLIRLQHTFDAWIVRVESFRAAGNTSTCHMLSNGILLLHCSRVTVADCAMRRPQYGGGGGNGYMFRIQSSHEILIRDSIADFSRHGFVLSHAGTSGNVFLRCEDRETQRATGTTGSYTTGGSGSDHHMHFSHSNLFDQCHAHNSFYTAHHRGTSGTIPHGLTSAHGVFWNTSGSGTRGGTLVRSEQARYGYVIGTSGTRASATNPTGGNTAPADHLEGLGMGATMEPPSLYLDQLDRRMQGLLVFLDGDTTVPPTSAHPLHATVHSYGGGPLSYQWSQISGPATSFSDATAPTTTVAVLEAGTYVFRLHVDDGDRSHAAQGTVTVDDAIVNPTETPAALVSVDGIVGRRLSNAPALGYHVGDDGTTVGCQGSFATATRHDRNVVYRYELPTLPVGEVPSAFSFSFQIVALRDHSGDNYQLHVYLLDSDDPTSTGTDLFYHGSHDAGHALVGSHFEAAGGSTDSITLEPPVNVTFTIDSGEALELLQGYYAGHVPHQAEAAFRFNLDRLFPNADLTGNALNRYVLNHAVAATGFHILSIPGPGITFDEWIDGFDLNGKKGFSDDPDGDGIPNGVEAWFGTHPAKVTRGLATLAGSGLVSTFTHPRNPVPLADITGFYEWSPDLEYWYPGGSGPEGGKTVNFIVESGNGTSTVTATTSEYLPRLFVRVAVTRM